MNNQWKKLKVEEFANVVGGGTPKTSIEEYWNGNIPWLTPKDLSGTHDRFISKGERFISKEGLENSSAKLLPENSVLLSSRAPVGYVAIAKNPIATNQGFRSLIPFDDYNSEFIYYLLLNNTAYLENHASGTTFRELSGSVLSKLEFNIPPLATQKRIADILGTLDDKIELNRQMNHTLEAMARAIFKSWFVDFDPVYAKLEGRDTPLPAEVLDLFPAELVESELGLIPKGWEVGKVSDYGEVITGKTPSTKNPDYYSGEDVPFLKIPDMHDQFFITETSNYLSLAGANSQENKYIPARSICVSCIATPGLVVMPALQVQTNQQINSVVPKSNLFSNFLLLALKRRGDEIRLRGSGGSVLRNLNKSDFSNITVIRPDNLQLKHFNNLISPLFDKIINNQYQNHIISKTRDILLSKLMSGEVEV